MSEEESYHENESVESNVEQKNVEGKGSKKLNQTSSSYKSNNTNKNNLNNSKMSSKNEQPVSIESTRAYLEKNVTEVVQKAMLELVKQNPKPDNPLKFVGEYILKEAKKK